MIGAMAIIEVFADVRCPFAHVGLRRLVQRRDAGEMDFTLRIRAWPLELVNGAPLDAELIGEEIEALREQVAPDLFTGFSVAAFPHTSLPALALTGAAYARGPEIGERVALGLRWALFEDGRDIARTDVLAALAERWGVPASPDTDGADAEVVADWRDGQARGVIGSPHFFLAGEGYFCPVLDISREGGRLRIVDNRPVFDEFVKRALAG
jgi:predicted DsbA family dithiol-disulfide isomerase